MQGTYSITDVAIKLDKSVSVIRKYEQDYSLDIMRNEIGHRVYTDADIEVLKRIIDLKNEGANIHLIKKVLHKEELIDLAPEVLGSIPTYTHSIDQFKKDIVKELQEQFKMQLQEELQKQEERIIEQVTQRHQEHIREENNRLMDYIAMTREEEKKTKKSFISSLFRGCK